MKIICFFFNFAYNDGRTLTPRRCQWFFLFLRFFASIKTKTEKTFVSSEIKIASFSEIISY